jgi:uncharacterized repeat protein (TIGR03803 family)
LTAAGNTIYGTTSGGGPDDGGSVFSFQADGSGFTNLHYFTTLTDGGSPGAGVLVVGHTIYGTAAYGGPLLDGSVFAMNTDGTGFIPLHFFTGTNGDGVRPYGDLSISGSTLYGTTISGGASNAGVVFSMNVDGGFYADLVNLSSALGANPMGGALLANQVLYGTTTEGATNGWGGIYGIYLPQFQALEITTQPVSVTNVTFGNTASFTVVAQSSVTLALEYQWRLNGVDLQGDTNSLLQITNVQASNCGVYTVAVSDGDSTLVSSNAALTPNVAFVTSNDITNNPTILSGLSGMVRSENTNATHKTGETPILPGNAPAKSIWFQWTAPADGIATFRTTGSDFDTVLGAFAEGVVGIPTNTRAGLADDDSGGNLTSAITFNATENQVYLIGVDGHDGASGNVLLSWVDVPGPAGPTIVVPPVTDTVVSNSASALFSCEASGEQDILWFKVGSSNSVGGGEDFGIGSVNDATVGTYFAVVSSSSGSVRTEPFQVQINLLEDGTSDSNSLAHNKFLDAALDPFTPPTPRGQHVRTGGGDTRGYTTSQTFSTVGNLSEPGEPTICGQIGGAPAWYAYEAPTNGAMFVNTLGSDFNTMLAVYNGTGTSFATLTNLGCGYAANAAQSQPQLFLTGAVKRQVFYIQVEGYHGASGAVQLNINFGQPVTAVSPLQDQSVQLGASAAFSIVAQGTTPLSYQWQFAGTNLPLATNASLNVPSVTAGQLGLYTVVVTNFVSRMSYSAQLAQAAAPVITGEPQSGVIHPGATATLSVTATGAPDPAYYWKFNGVATGGYSNTLVIPDFQSTNEGTYSVVASNYLGVAPASNALLLLDTFRLIAPTLTTGAFEMQMAGPAGSNYYLQTSTDLSNWTPFSSNYAMDGILDFSDTNAGAQPMRFYRVISH